MSMTIGLLVLSLGIIIDFGQLLLNQRVESFGPPHYESKCFEAEKSLTKLKF